MKGKQASLIPSVGKVLQEEYIKILIKDNGRDLITRVVREEIATIRQLVLSGKPVKSDLQSKVLKRVDSLNNGTHKKVLNASGVILHTNLGRAPIGHDILSTVLAEVSSYSNLEFNLKNGERGSRYSHIKDTFAYLCGAEDCVVVNNNAAAVLVSLSALAKDREVIVSRGELIEIGGSFRMPDVMAAAGCKLIEVGSTNKTRLSDYANAITENTAAIMKVHHSNFSIHGFTQETGLDELSHLCKDKGVSLLYDLGSGIPCPNPALPFKGEPDVKTSLEQGADVVMFSGDKLLSGAQGGILVGKSEYIKKIAKDPLMRAMRISKLDLAVLAQVSRCFFKTEDLKRLPVYHLLLRSSEARRKLAEQILQRLTKENINCVLVDSRGQMGGGTLPDLELPSFALELQLPGESGSQRALSAEKFHRQLLKRELPLVGYLKSGLMYIDVLSLFEEDVDDISLAIIETWKLLVL